MSAYRNCCVLCGAPIERWFPDADESQDEDESHDEDESQSLWPQWMQEFRAIYAQDMGSTTAYLSGPGIIFFVGDDIGMISAGVDSDGDPLPDVEDFEVFLQHRYDRDWEDDYAWGFPFHLPCWKILGLVRPGDRLHIQHLFDILRSFPIAQGIMNFGHDYGGLAQYGDGTNLDIFTDSEERPLIPGPVSKSQKCNPFLEIPSVRRFLKRKGAGYSGGATMATSAYAYHSTTGVDPFSKLSVEILQFILEFLPTTAISPLRQSSKCWANIPLPVSFWRSRFIPGQEFDFIFEVWLYESSLRGKWGPLYNLVRRTIPASPAVRNRKRVWRLASSLWALIDIAGSTYLEGDNENHYSLRWITSSWGVRFLDREFSSGSLELYTRSLAIPRGEVTVSVSDIELCGKRYISSIRLDWANDGLSALGHRPRSKNKVREILGRMEIAGFCLARDERGIRGIAVFSTTGALSKWAGDHEDIPKRRLVLDPVTSVVKYLKGGFDRLKLVSLSISDGAKGDWRLESKLPLRDTALWSPSVPSPSISFLGLDEVQGWGHDGGRPIALILFGTTLQTLKDVRQVTVWRSIDPLWSDWHAPSYSYAWSLEVSYAGGTPPARFGVDDGFEWMEEMHFDLYYATGEYISGMEVIYHLNDLLGVKIHTNTGRVSEFPPERTKGLIERDISVKGLFPEHGTVVGFCSRVSLKRGLTDLGLVYTTPTTREHAPFLWDGTTLGDTR